ncbi:hypothetical protein M3Y98_00131300 [Aphelenchoides besseyi]|nr:hypothetical protein M3Y98_00131300 [Aphelenchoides besseyi]KAI6199614.1 hypothetical protein M3Y96_00645700 [Aphelenchoides besseyi]
MIVTIGNETTGCRSTASIVLEDYRRQVVVLRDQETAELDFELQMSAFIEEIVSKAVNVREIVHDLGFDVKTESSSTSITHSPLSSKSTSLSDLTLLSTETDVKDGNPTVVAKSPPELTACDYAVFVLKPATTQTKEEDEDEEV